MTKHPRPDRLYPRRPNDIHTSVEEMTGLKPGVCDYCCLRLELVVCYPTADVTTDSAYDTVRDGKIYHVVQDNVHGWAACQECAGFIDRQDWDGLLRRYMRLVHLRQPDASFRFFEDVEQRVRAFWRQAFILAWPRWIETPEPARS